MLTTEEASVTDSLTTALFPTAYAPSSSGGVSGLNQNGFPGSNNSSNNGNGLQMTFDSSAGSEYAFLMDSHQQEHQLHKRTREFSEEEIQAQYLDQVEEYQWSQTMALRSVVQQQHQNQPQQQQQQQPQQFRQEQQPFQYGQQQPQRVDLGAHSQRSPLQQQPQQHQQQVLHQPQSQATQSLSSPLRHYQNQQSYQSQQQPYRDQHSGVLDAPQLGSQQGSQLRQQSLGTQQEPYQQLSQPQGQQQQLSGYQSQYPLRSPPIDLHPTQQPQRSLSAGMLAMPRGGADHITASTASSQRPVFDSSQFHLSRHQEAPQPQLLHQQEQRSQPLPYPDTPISSLPPLSASIDTPLARPSPNIPSFPYFPPAMLVSYSWGFVRLMADIDILPMAFNDRTSAA
jgi:hypothetical protein